MQCVHGVAFPRYCHDCRLHELAMFGARVMLDIIHSIEGEGLEITMEEVRSRVHNYVRRGRSKDG